MRRGIFVGLLWACVALAGCSKQPVAVTSVRGLTFSSEGKTIAWDAGQVSVSVIASKDWTLTVAEDWVTPGVTQGVGTGKVQAVYFTVDDNSTAFQRESTVTFRATGESEPYTFKITQNPRNTLTGINQWIHKELTEHYYWNEVVKVTSPPANSLSPVNFFDEALLKLPWKSVQDSSNGESAEYPTIDGPWGGDKYNTKDGSVRYLYSFMEWPDETIATPTRANGSAHTFGMWLKGYYYNVGSSTQVYQLLVTAVQPKSPAWERGIRRGDWIVRYNNAQINQSAMSQLSTIINSDRGSIDITTQNMGRLTLTSADSPNDPIFFSGVFTTSGGNKAAYLNYNEFEWGKQESGNNFSFHRTLRDAFSDFRAKGANNFVIDLRNNGGGYIETCRVLTSLISGAGSGEVFVKMKRSPTNPDAGRLGVEQQLTFTGEAGLALAQRRIYVLTSGKTASASEMLVSSLRGIGFSVVIIGERTNGKNVGMDQIVGTGMSAGYTLWPITFKCLNAVGFCDYAGGFTPDLYLDQYRGASSGGTIYDFGNPKERLLAAALTMIDGGTVNPDTQTRSRASQPDELGPHRAVGAKYTPEQKR